MSPKNNNDTKFAFHNKQYTKCRSNLVLFFIILLTSYNHHNKSVFAFFIPQQTSSSNWRGTRTNNQNSNKRHTRIIENVKSGHIKKFASSLNEEIDNTVGEINQDRSTTSSDLDPLLVTGDVFQSIP